MKAKILIVDDEPINLTTMEAFLAADDYELHFATNGVDALAQAQIEQPDLILLDVMMPDMDGFAVTRRLRDDPVLGRIPIMLVTALADEQSRLEGLRAGADDFITKPCRREEIRARVRTVASLNRFRTIAEQRLRFERLFEIAPGAIVVVDAEGRVVAANARAEIHRPGESVYAPFSPDSVSTLRALVAEAGRGETGSGHEVTLGAAGMERVLQVHAAAVPDVEARLAMLVFTDVTTEAHARAALARMNAELEEVVRARTRQLEESNGLLMSYAGFVSHDLRSPLTVMKGYLSMIQEGLVPINAEAAPLVQQAFEATVTMQELIENILQLAQDEHDGTSHRTAVDPTPMVNRVARRVRDIFPRLKPRITVAALPRVGVSAVVVERVFYNLVANALKYSAQRATPTVEIGVLPGAAAPVIFVRDNGVGFDSRDADRLFREFSRLDTAHGTEGFGLGLSLVARLLRAHGGRIWAESAVGAGATFYVQFPAPAPVALAAGG